MKIQGRRICIIVPSSKARGTIKVVSDYKADFEALGVDVVLTSPPTEWPKWKILAWELLALYLGSCREDDILLSPNGRISPRVFLARKRVYMLVLLDTMNVGLKKLIRSRYSLTERLNILINSILMPLSIRRSKYLTAISHKTARDFEIYLGGYKSRSDGLRGCLGNVVVYPSGSFRDTLLADGEISHAWGDSEQTAIWISGETRNKQFIEGVDLLKRYASDIDVQRISVYGIASKKLRDSARKHLDDSGCKVEFESVNSREEKLVQCYLDTSVALCLSKEEGYGIPFLDAIMMGIPVIATNIDTYIEILDLGCKMIDSLPPILWVKNSIDGRLDIDRDEIRSFEILKRDYCLPSRAQRAKRYLEFNSNMTSRSRRVLASYFQ